MHFSHLLIPLQMNIKLTLDITHAHRNVDQIIKQQFQNVVMDQFATKINSSEIKNQVAQLKMKELDIVLVEIKMGVVIIYYDMRNKLEDMLTVRSLILFILLFIFDSYFIHKNVLRKVRTTLGQIRFQKNVFLSIRISLQNIILVFREKLQIVCNAT